MKQLHLHKTLMFFMFMLSAMHFTIAQSLNTFSLTIKGEELTVTKDINPIFIGTYTQITDNGQKQFPLLLEDNANFKWGATVAGDELSTVDIMEYSGGKMISYVAYSIYYQNIATGEEGELMLYELGGKKYLGQAEKIESVAENH